MEAVSAAKMRKAQTTAIKGRAYARASTSILARVSGSRALQNNSLVVVRPAKKALYICITSDKGLAGALNSAVLRATASDIAEEKFENKNVSIIAVGRKANDFFGKRGFEVSTYHPNTDQISSEMIRKIIDTAAARFTEGAVDVVKVSYQNFRSTFEQRPTLRTIFPLSLAELERVVSDILPARGALADAKDAARPSVYTIEPSEEEVLSVLLPRLASIFLYHALLESQASEHSARMVAMKSASDKAEERSEGLTLKFNKARQSAITREVSEITGGMEAMAN